MDFSYLYVEYKTGKTLKELGDKVNVSRKTIARHFLKKGFALRTKKESFSFQNRFGENNNYWKGGKHNKGNGYIEIIVEGKKWYEHQYVYCQFHKIEKIPEGYRIHHIDKNKSNNKIENLQLLTHQQHMLLHKQNKRLV